MLALGIATSSIAGRMSEAASEETSLRIDDTVFKNRS